MTLIVRVYRSQRKARDAIKKLKASGFREDSVFVMTPSAEADVNAVVAAAVDAGRLPKAYTEIATAGLREGRSILTVDAPSGQDLLAAKIMEGVDPVKSKDPEEPKPEEVKPVEAVKEAVKQTTKSQYTSEAWGIPLLWNGKSFLANMFGGELASSNFYFFGAPKLKDNPAPLSTCANISLLSDDPAPLSAKIGRPVLTDKPYSAGEPVLTSDAAPLSSKLGLPVLSETKKEWTHSMGQPMLMSEPAPFSKALGWPVLSDD